jgi:carbonic anhydrase
VHFVHQNGRGELVVLAVLFSDGARHDGLAKIGENAPRQIGASEAFDISLADLEFVLADRDYYRYSGSLTTPPCTEGVTRLVLKNTGHVASAQVDWFVKLIGGDARGPQALNGREILQ